MENLANKIRPESLKDLVGQVKIKILLSKIIQKQIYYSFIFYGPSGIGKTTCALILAKSLNLKWSLYNATIENKKHLIEKIEASDVLIVNEFHCLTKQNQEVLLPHLENGSIIIYATTTENPYFKILPSIRSRMSLLVFDKISNEDLSEVVKNINKTNKLGLKLNDNLIKSIVNISNGDLRSTLNNLELISLIYKNKEINFEDLKTILPIMNFTSDKDGNYHYNNLSAFHKSLRGSDVDAALYYGFLILKSGDIDGFIRRIINVVYEDIGLANRLLDLKVHAAVQSMEKIGFPLANNIAAKIVTEIALSPKSNSTYTAGVKWNALINQGHVYDIPLHLKDAHYKSALKLKHGVGYKYAHDYLYSYVEQKYLPKELEGLKYFELGSSANEKRIESYWNEIKDKENLKMGN